MSARPTGVLVSWVVCFLEVGDGVGGKAVLVAEVPSKTRVWQRSGTGSSLPDEKVRLGIAETARRIRGNLIEGWVIHPVST